MKSLKALLILSLLVNILFVGIGGFVVYKKGGIDFVKNQISAVASTQEYPNYYLQKKDIFETAEIQDVEKVFVGDSITDHGELQESFPEQVVLNRGISNDNAKGVLNRIDEVVQRNAEEVYLLIGVNDILHSTSIEDYERNIAGIVESFEGTDTKLFVQSILPVNNEIYGDAVSNETVKKFNEALKTIAGNEGVNYVDLNPHFADSEGQLKNEFTLDGIHLTGAGYEEWMKHINP